ncbi:unnamed protein product [Gulo gulo]|uniref:Uncharacterized protein n=1 Tax=Gulo gulo TaxID=48420 RepID=A0A9X9LIN8_GULGU|nr:unnamed protein product [Gulo gulo]
MANYMNLVNLLACYIVAEKIWLHLKSVSIRSTGEQQAKEHILPLNMGCWNRY